MEFLKEYLLIWSISNILAIIFLLIARKNTRLARLIFFLVFGLACWVNYTTAHDNPEGYLDYAAFTPFDIYRDFISGWFSKNIVAMVTLIAIGQGAIALGLLLNGWWVRLACLGAIIFLLAIAPLGIGSGFPFSIIAIIALVLILKNDHLDYLWKFNKIRAM